MFGELAVFIMSTIMRLALEYQCSRVDVVFDILYIPSLASKFGKKPVGPTKILVVSAEFSSARVFLHRLVYTRRCKSTRALEKLHPMRCEQGRTYQTPVLRMDSKPSKLQMYHMGVLVRSSARELSWESRSCRVITLRQMLACFFMKTFPDLWASLDVPDATRNSLEQFICNLYGQKCSDVKPGLRTILIFNLQDWPYFLCTKKWFIFKNSK